MMERKRQSYDQLCAVTQKREREISSLETTLADLRKEGVAMGLTEFPKEEERMESIESISTRRIYCKHTVPPPLPFPPASTHTHTNPSAHVVTSCA